MIPAQTIVFMVEMGDSHFITLAYDREHAKRNARTWIGGDPDEYTVSPLTDPGDRIKFDLAVSS